MIAYGGARLHYHPLLARWFFLGYRARIGILYELGVFADKAPFVRTVSWAAVAAGRVRLCALGQNREPVGE